MKLSEYVTQVINDPKYGRDLEWVRANLHRAHIETIEAAHDAEVRGRAFAEAAGVARNYDTGYDTTVATIAEALADAAAARGVVAEEPEWEYVPGWIATDGRARISQGVIVPSYVADFIAEGGEVVRRRVSKFETVTADMVPVQQENDK